MPFGVTKCAKFSLELFLSLDLHVDFADYPMNTVPNKVSKAINSSFLKRNLSHILNSFDVG